MPSKNSTRARFPRIPTAHDIGEIARAVWEHPKFFVRYTENSTEFVHRLKFNIQMRVKTQRSAVFQMLFVDQNVNWDTEFLEAYESAQLRGKPVRATCDGALYQVIVRTLHSLFQRAKISGKEFTQLLAGEPAALAQASRRKRLARPDIRSHRAVKLARRYTKIKPQVSKLREFVKKRTKGLDEAALIAEVEKNFQFGWVRQVTKGKALRNLPDVPPHPLTTDSLGALEWTPRQLVVGIIKCEEDERDVKPRLRATTVLEKYIPLGRRLIAAAASSTRRS